MFVAVCYGRLGSYGRIQPDPSNPQTLDPKPRTRVRVCRGPRGECLVEGLTTSFVFSACFGRMGLGVYGFGVLGFGFRALVAYGLLDFN